MAENKRIDELTAASSLNDSDLFVTQQSSVAKKVTGSVFKAFMESVFEKLSNKVTAFQSTPDDTHYASEKLVKDSLDAKINASNPTGTGSLSLNRKASTTVGTYSVAEGSQTEASATASHAEGKSSVASGQYSHVEGYETRGTGVAAHAEGYACEAGNYAHAEGRFTTAKSEAQHVQGKFNKVDNNNAYADIIGGGSSSLSLANIETVDWNGNLWVKTDVMCGGTDMYAPTHTLSGKESLTNVAPNYSASSTYAVGDYVHYNNALYRCTTAITTAEAWTDDHWESVVLGEEVSELKEDLDELGFSVVDGKLCVTY